MAFLKLKNKRKINRKVRIRKKISGTSEKPRLSIFRSNRYIYVQAIDDVNAKTLASVCSLNAAKTAKKTNKVDNSMEVGKKMGEMLKKKNITTAVFDRSGVKYHGRVKALADGIRSIGIKF